MSAPDEGPARDMIAALPVPKKRKERADKGKKRAKIIPPRIGETTAAQAVEVSAEIERLDRDIAALDAVLDAPERAVSACGAVDENICSSCPHVEITLPAASGCPVSPAVVAGGGDRSAGGVLTLSGTIRPVIFLDFDGVIVTRASMHAATGERAHFEDGCADPACVAALNDLTTRSGAQIVVSSAWRHSRTAAGLANLLRSWGVTGEVIDRTRDDSHLLTTQEIRAGKPYLGDSRGEQIAAWLACRPGCPFVILDDLDDMGDLRSRLVLTNKESGLQDRHVERAIAILRGEAPAGGAPSWIANVAKSDTETPSPSGAAGGNLAPMPAAPPLPRSIVSVMPDEIAALFHDDPHAAHLYRELQARHARTVGSPEWRAARRSSIGSSEIAAVCGLDPRRGPIDIYAEKVGLIDGDADNVYTRRGRRFEPVVADWYSEEVGLKVRPIEPRAHPLFPWASASPDREREDGRLVECKTVIGHKRHEWGEPGTDEVPLGYLAQVQWQMFVFDRRVCDVAALIDLDLRIYTVYRDNDIVETLRATAEKFWRENVEAKIAPEPSESEGTRAYLAAKYPRSGDGCLPATPHVLDLAKKYEAAHQDVKSATARKDFTRNLLVDLIGDARGFALGDGETVTNATNKTGKRAFRLSTITRKDDE